MIYSGLIEKFGFANDKVLTQGIYEDIGLNSLASMFTYKGFENEKNFRTQFIELYLLCFGQCAVWRYEGDLIVSYCNRAGKPNVNGLGSDLICTTQNGYTTTFRDFENSKEVVFIQNNTVIAPDLNIPRFSAMLTEIDKSIYNNVINSRYSPIVVAKDEVTKKIIEKALENNDSGKPQTIASNNLLSEEKEEYVLNITDVTASDKIQYLMKAHEDLLRRIYTLYGMNIKGSGKMAQITRAEVNDGSESSMIIPYDRLHWREEGIKKINEYFGLNAEVKFSTPWELAFDDIILYNIKSKLDNKIDSPREDEINVENIDDEVKATEEMGEEENE